MIGAKTLESSCMVMNVGAYLCSLVGKVKATKMAMKVLRLFDLYLNVI